MSTHPPNHDDLPQAVVDDRRRVSLVWLIPLVTVLAAAWLGYHAYQQQGPLVTVSFTSAEGLEAGRTRVRFKDVDVGVVEAVSLTPDLTGVRVQLRLSGDIEGYLNDQTRFWIVRPRLSGGGVSGLETLVGGTYIAADFALDGRPRRVFEGLETPPTVSASEPGRAFTLSAADLGSLKVGSPLLYRGIEVGRVVGYTLSAARGVDVQVFVQARHADKVTTDTRFWNVSGMRVSLTAEGVELSADSLASILFGGVAFGVPEGTADAAPAAAGTRFALFADRQSALAKEFDVREHWQLEFVGSVRGLLPGAPVEFRGIRIGEVVDVSLQIDAERRAARIPVTVAIEPERLGIRPDPGADPGAGSHERGLWNQLVDNGLRAQLKTGNLLAGALYVDLDFYPEDAPRQIAWDGPLPVMPTVPTPFDELRGLLARLAKLPLDNMAEDLGASLAALRDTMDSTNTLLRRLDRETASELTKTLAQTRATLVGVERFLQPNSPLQTEAQRALREFGSAARSLRIMADYLERHPEALIRGKGAE